MELREVETASSKLQDVKAVNPELQDVKIATPKVYVVGRTDVEMLGISQFLYDHTGDSQAEGSQAEGSQAHNPQAADLLTTTAWRMDDESSTTAGEKLAELGGRVCYMSFGDRQGKTTNAEYLVNILDQGHGSVLEHASWSLLITGISRTCTHELVRHRIGFSYCLSGDTNVYSELSAKHRRYGVKKRSLRYLYELSKTPWGPSRIAMLTLRVLDESTNTFVRGGVRRVLYSGVKDVFEVRLSDSKSIKCSRDHRFLTREGWKPLWEIVHGLDISPGEIAVHGSLDTPIATNGIVAYKDETWLTQRYVTQRRSRREIAEEAGVSETTIYNWLVKYGLQRQVGSGQSGRTPWNKRKRYKANWHHTEENKLLFSDLKKGPSNPSWKGGVTAKVTLARKLVETVRQEVYTRDNFTCRRCGVRGGKLTIHHVLPVWAREDLIADPSNLVTVCADCHLKMNGKELEYAHLFEASPEVVQELMHKEWLIPRGNVLIPRYTKIANITYVGKEDTYDLEMEGPNHNFVANGIVTHNSQLSQRFVDESETSFVLPEGMRELIEKEKAVEGESITEKVWLTSMQRSLRAYEVLVNRLARQYILEHPNWSVRERRIRARQAARSVLPNATETKILVTANARAWRHFLEMRGSAFAEVEIRRLAVMIYRVLVQEAQHLFADFSVSISAQNEEFLHCTHSKV